MTALVIYRLISLGFLEYFNCSMFLNDMNTLNSICWLLCYVPKLAISQLECQFVGVLLLVEERFKILNNELTRLNRTKKVNVILVGSKLFARRNETAARLSFVRKLHWRLCATSRNLNRIFGTQILLVVGIHFVTFITYAYSTLSGLIKIVILRDNEILIDIVTSLSWGVANLINMFVLCFCCSSVMHEVSGNTNRFDQVFTRKLLSLTGQPTEEYFTPTERSFRGVNRKRSKSSLFLFKIT